MSIKAKIATGAATLTVVGAGLGLAGTMTASAATPSCNAGCEQLFSQKFGHQYVVDVYQGRAKAGQPVILFQSSNTDPAEDFQIVSEGTVGSFYRHHYHLVSAQFAKTYSADQTAEIEYSPYGVNSNFCLSTPGQTAREDDDITLQGCGQTAGSLFAADEAHAVAGRGSEGGYVPLISGATTSFSNPLVLNYPEGNPTDMPRPQLNVEPEQSYSGGQVYDNQEWGAQGGPVHGAARL